MKTERTVRRFFSTLALVSAVYASQSFNPIVVVSIAFVLESVLIGFTLGILEAIQESN